MKVQICNLGPIKKADIELKPLTVFIGCNGTGKTWTAYTLASILDKHGLDKYLKSYLEDKSQSLYPTIDNAIEQLLQEGNAQINILKFANEYGETYINHVAELAPTWMSSFMASERIKFEELKIIFDLSDLKINLLEKIKNKLIEIEISSSPHNQDPLLNVTKERGEEIIYFYTVSEGKINILDKIPKRAVRKLLFDVVFSAIHSSLFSYVYPFPTERTTFIALNVLAKPKTMAIEKSLEEPEEQASISRPKRGQQLIYPIQSFLTMMLNASLTNMEEREYQIKQNPQILNYVRLAEFLEKNILQGNLEFEKSDFQNELLFQTTQGIKLEMPIVSSMVKELAPLVLCLRYLAEPDQLLIIDEPEMNLHPAAQVEIIEFLAMLANAGLNILITTHSPYIVDHLANLIKAAKHEDKESIKEKFYLEKTEAFISQEKVAVYLFEDGTAKSILDEEGRIDWGTFSDVSEDISHIFP